MEEGQDEAGLDGCADDETRETHSHGSAGQGAEMEQWRGGESSVRLLVERFRALDGLRRTL
jgi:hypothetical protein